MLKGYYSVSSFFRNWQRLVFAASAAHEKSGFTDFCSNLVHFLVEFGLIVCDFRLLLFQAVDDPEQLRSGVLRLHWPSQPSNSHERTKQNKKMGSHCERPA